MTFLRIGSIFIATVLLVFSAEVTSAIAFDEAAAASAKMSTDGNWTLFTEAQKYEEGRGVARNWQRARKLYQRVIEGSNKKAAGYAALALGKHYSKRGSRNWTRAAGYFETGASLGEAWSIMQLAEMYERGRGVRKSARRARHLYTRAASAGDPKVRMYAYAALGKLYMRPPLREDQKAIKNLREAIRLGEYWSAYPLIELYAARKNTPQNRARIRSLLLVLKNSGDPKAVESAAYLSRKLPQRQ